MDEKEGEVEAALEGPQVGQERGDLGGGVFLKAVQAHEGVEDKQPGLVCLDCGSESGLVLVAIEPELLVEDEEDGELIEVYVSGVRQTQEPVVDVRGCVLCGEEEHGPGVVDREAAEARGSGGNGEGDFKSQIGLAGLGCPTDDADGLVAPEALDEPRGMVRGFGRQF